MKTKAPFVFGYVTRLGYLYCPPCAEARGHLDDAKAVALPSDRSSHEGEACDGCGRTVTRTR